MNNRKRLEEMGDEELAAELCLLDFCEECRYTDDRYEGVCGYLDAHPDGRMFEGCKEAALKWLREECGA